eukprot:scaffold38358_cov70-Phaeocystis_antarctica.AAC.1
MPGPGPMDRPMGDEPPSENVQRATAIMNVLTLSPSNGVAYLQAGAGLERMSQLRQSADVLRTAVRLLPQHAKAYDRLGVVLYKAAMRVEWSVFRDQPGLQQPPDRLPGDEDTCWRAAEPNCFEIEHYGPQQLHMAEADFLRRVEKSKGDTRAVLLLWRKRRLGGATARQPDLQRRTLQAPGCATQSGWAPEPRRAHGEAVARPCARAQVANSAPLNAQVQSIRLDPRRATPYLTLAHVLPVGGSPALYRRALQLDPTQGDVYLWHGDALHKLRYYKQAQHLASLYLTLTHLTSPHRTSPWLTLPHLTSPHLTSPYLSLPYLISRAGQHSVPCGAHTAAGKRARISRARRGASATK